MSIDLNIKQPLVSVEWLAKNMDAENLVILDATMPKVTWEKNTFEDEDIQIPNARYLDIKNVFSDTSAEFPNTMLSAKKFQEKARLLGIKKDSAIVVYDTIGIYTSPRVWWMFKAMGHNNIAVLDGGLPEWLNNGFSTEEVKSPRISIGDFTANYDEKFFSNYNKVLNSLNDKTTTILDARSYDRFMGLVDEPREGLRVGHIPNSKNLPYSNLLVNGKFNDRNAQRMLKQLVQNNNNVIFSCGSGITACILALGAEIAGIDNLSVYDGSWTEWGSLHQLPIQKK
jgi:thiosulfate/3-mercaptopyruvate sulfurtransferase